MIKCQSFCVVGGCNPLDAAVAALISDPAKICQQGFARSLTPGAVVHKQIVEPNTRASQKRGEGEKVTGEANDLAINLGEQNKRYRLRAEKFGRQFLLRRFHPMRVSIELGL